MMAKKLWVIVHGYLRCHGGGVELSTPGSRLLPPAGPEGPMFTELSAFLAPIVGPAFIAESASAAVLGTSSILCTAAAVPCVSLFLVSQTECADFTQEQLCEQPHILCFFICTHFAFEDVTEVMQPSDYPATKAPRGLLRKLGELARAGDYPVTRARYQGGWLRRSIQHLPRILGELARGHELIECEEEEVFRSKETNDEPPELIQESPES